MGDHAVSIAEATIRMKGRQRIPAVEKKKSKKWDVMKDFVETTSELYLNGSVDKAYEVATMDEKNQPLFRKYS